MYYTYVIQSLKTESIYIGQTNDLEDRISRHNGNRNKSTKGKGPWELIYSQIFSSRAEAVRLERKLKGFKNKEYLLRWIKESRV